MKKTLIGLLGSTVICVLFLAGCIDEHYGEDSNTIVTNLTGYAWERTFQIRTEDGRDAEVCEHYEFGLNGKASCKSRTTCDSEEVEEHVHYFRYDFITPNNRYLLLDYCYWQIDRISSSVLSIYETFENPVFKWLAKHDHVMVIAWIYVFTLIIVITFAIEIGQKVTNTGNMEFADIVFGVVGFIVMFFIFAVIREIYKGIVSLIRDVAHQDQNRSKKRHQRAYDEYEEDVMDEDDEE